MSCLGLEKGNWRLKEASNCQKVAQHVAKQETWVRSLGREDSLEKEMATHSRILAWRIPWTEELGRLQSTGSQRVGHDWATSLSFSCITLNCALSNWLSWFVSLFKSVLRHQCQLHLRVRKPASKMAPNNPHFLTLTPCVVLSPTASWLSSITNSTWQKYAAYAMQNKILQLLFRALLLAHVPLGISNCEANSCHFVTNLMVRSTWQGTEACSQEPWKNWPLTTMI